MKVQEGTLRERKDSKKWHRLLVGLLLCGLLSTLVAACGIYDVSAVPTGPTVHMGAADFLQPSITIHQGDSLTLVDDVASTHIIKNGTWVNGVAKPGKEHGAPASGHSIRPAPTTCIARSTRR